MKTRRGFAFWIIATTLTGVPGAAQSNSSPDLASQVRQLALEVRVLKLEICRLYLQQIQYAVAPMDRELKAVQARRLKLESSEKTVRDEMALAVQRMQQNTLTREERRDMAELIHAETGESGELDRLLRQLRETTQREAELSRQVELEHQRWTAIRAMADALEAEIRQIQPAR